ncbi:hypothetical protein [uncultured Devosia sp.]|uniref:hypothetical protein n=1 Tax=uncultured Devosia sp. TaxID=211434 RepID=UPI0035CAE1BE
MFLARSVFWLLAAYMVIRPGVGLDPAALTDHAVNAGQQIVAEQVQAIACESLQCAGGKAVLAAILPDASPAGQTMQVQPTVRDVPYPRPRLDRAS